MTVILNNGKRHYNVLKIKPSIITSYCYLITKNREDTIEIRKDSIKEISDDCVKTSEITSSDDVIW